VSSEDIPRNEILVGDALEKLKELPDDSVDTAMTSPPYWGLRDYGEEDQLGLEPKPEKYVENLMEVFKELKRVLKPTGTFYLNIDDTYYSGKGKSGHATDTAERNEKGETINEGYQTPDKLDTIPSKNRDVDLPDKSMSMIPERVMMAMVDNGWILRNKVVWRKKGGGMPESVKDRFSTTWEYVYMFSLNQDYYFDLDAVRESYDSRESGKSYNPGNKQTKELVEHFEKQGSGGNFDGHDWSMDNGGKNPGDMWTVATANMSEAHFAVYPKKLCEKPVKAGCPKKVCSECRKPYVRVTEESVSFHSGSGKAGNTPKGKHKDRQEANSGEYDIRKGPRKNVDTLRFDSSCHCDTEETQKGVILDPFAGAGTTCLVARKFNRDYIGIELNEEYAEMARERIRDEVGGQPLDKFLEKKQSKSEEVRSSGE